MLTHRRGDDISRRRARIIAFWFPRAPTGIFRQRREGGLTPPLPLVKEDFVVLAEGTDPPTPLLSQCLLKGDTKTVRNYPPSAILPLGVFWHSVSAFKIYLLA